jgi:hypothetical protein
VIERSEYRHCIARMTTDLMGVNLLSLSSNIFLFLVPIDVTKQSQYMIGFQPVDPVAITSIIPSFRSVSVAGGGGIRHLSLKIGRDAAKN